MTNLSENNLYTPSSLNRELKIHEKKLRTLETLEAAVTLLGEQIAQAYAICPFGHDSLDVQRTVTVGINWSTEYLATINTVRNQATLEHLNAIEVLSTEAEQGKKGTSISEDDFAMAKSNLTQELDASRNFKKNDNARAQAFEAKLDSLTKAYLLADNKEVNTGNSCTA